MGRHFLAWVVGSEHNNDDRIFLLLLPVWLFVLLIWNAFLQRKRNITKLLLHASYLLLFVPHVRWNGWKASASYLKLISARFDIWPWLWCFLDGLLCYHFYEVDADRWYNKCFVYGCLDWVCFPLHDVGGVLYGLPDHATLQHRFRRKRLLYFRIRVHGHLRKFILVKWCNDSRPHNED